MPMLSMFPAVRKSGVAINSARQSTSNPTSAPLFASRRKLADGLPAAPGVYAFRSASGEVLYVGKATDLRSRVRSYFASDHRESVKTRALVLQVTDLETIVVPSEAHALVLDDSGDSALTAALSAGGYTIVRARSTGELRRALETQPYLAFAFDAGRHDGQLAKILSIVRTVHPNLPVVVTSEVASGELVRAVSHYHGVEYLGRPYTPAEMTEAVENALKTGRVAVLQSKLLAARAGADVFLDDLEATEQAFEQALDSLFMVYQPIVRSRDHSIFGYEALLRCNVPALPNPPAVLTAAEVLGRVVDLGRVVRRKVRDDIDALEDGISVFVNLHPLELREKYLASSSEPLMSATRRIVLEVTERASLSGGPQLLEEVRRLRGHGYRIAVDDLGEGYAGLSSLAHLTPDIVKIDRSLVERIETSPLKEDIVASIVLMARKAGITTVAEGIETVEERDVLTMLGCDLLQGYYFARPGLPFPPVITT